MAFLQLTAIIVKDYDDAITFFTQALGFELIEDSPARTNDGRAKRWVVVRPPGAQTGVLLARAEGDEQLAAIGNQHAGRVGFFLCVDDFDARYQRMRAAGVEFLTEPRTEPYGRVVVFRDISGNRWDLLASNEAQLAALRDQHKSGPPWHRRTHHAQPAEPRAPTDRGPRPR